jgi:hypothetical protein
MKKTVILAYLFLSSINNINGQLITASYLHIYSKTTAVVPLINGVNGDQGTDNSFSFSYEHFMKNKRYSIVSSYSKFNGCTLIYFERGGVIAGGGELSAKGFCQGVDLRRIDAGLAYLLTKRGKKWYFKPFAEAGLQWSRKTGVEYWGDGLPINGPNYFELEPMRAEPMNTTQIVPSLGFRTGFVFWKRLDIGLSVQGVYAFKPYQKMYLNYQYKGVIQPMAEYESTGTGLFVGLGIGYRFARWIK